MRYSFAALLTLMPVQAFAGAWTLPQGTAQIITTVTESDASKSFDGHGNASQDVTFHKTFLSAYSEYGWKKWLTLIVDPEYAIANSAGPGRATQDANDFAISGGARVRLFHDSNSVFSVQATARSAGAFELDTSFNEDPGEDFELRALYGRSFKLFGHQACIDLQVAQRWTTGKRPNETPVDLTFIYNIGWKTQVFVQNFNIISEGSGEAPFDYYRYDKVSLSLVHPWWHKLSLQFGVFISPTGQNALKERGLFTAVWAKF